MGYWVICLDENTQLIRLAVGQ